MSIYMRVWVIGSEMLDVSLKKRNLVNLLKLMASVIRFSGGLTTCIKKARRVFLREGWMGVKRRILFVDGNPELLSASKIRPDINLPAVDRNDYDEWVRRYDTLTDTKRNKIKLKIADFQNKPLISVVMPVYNPQVSFLDKAIQSVRNQLYPHWELCIADDASSNIAIGELLERHCSQDSRIKIVFREKNEFVSCASNSALELATGEFVALVDHDDLLPEHALYWVVDAINRYPDVGLIYSDEDKVDKFDQRYNPYFKCDFNYELMLAQNMISHLGVYRADIIHKLGFRVGFEDSQAYDLALRVIEQLKPTQIIHIPRILYHCRVIARRSALSFTEKNYTAETANKAVTEHLHRTQLSAELISAPEAPTHHRICFKRVLPQPLVSIIIPTRDRIDLLAMCVDSIIKRTSYSNYEVIIIDNGSVDDATQVFFDGLPKDRFRIMRDESPFNFSALNNKAARIAYGEFLCLMNNDIEILTPDWLEEMVSFAVRSDVGCVGARLWYPDGSLQHAGVILGIGGVAGHVHLRLERGNTGYFDRAVLPQSFSAITAACLLVRRCVFEEVSGLNENLAVAYNDIDFCLRVRNAGYRNVWTPYAEMNHHESASRGFDDTPEKQVRYAKEVEYMKQRWGESLLNDPAYSPNLSLNFADMSLAWPPRVKL